MSLLQERHWPHAKGVVLDTRTNFCEHIEAVCAKADATIGAIRGLLPNVKGPYNACRKLSYQVWVLDMLYTSPLWVDAL